jgi:CRP-like cAMP-binding protein
MGFTNEISKIILMEDSLLFKTLDESGRNEILENGEFRTFRAGQVIFREGELGDSFYLIKQGAVKVTTAMGGAPVELATLQRGSVFGEVAVLSGKPRTATAEAVTDLQTLCFRKELVERIMGQNPRFRELLEAVVLGRARDTIEKVVRATGQIAPGAGAEPEPPVSTLPPVPEPVARPAEPAGGDGNSSNDAA